MTKTITDVVCPFCGTLCDDLEVSVTDDGKQILDVYNACAIGAEKFLHSQAKDRITRPRFQQPDGTWNIKLTVAVFRPWRGLQATIASDPTFNAAPPLLAHVTAESGNSAQLKRVAGCPGFRRAREPLTPRVARPIVKKTGADGRD